MSRLIDTYDSQCGNHSAKVYRDSGHGCFVVKLFSFGVHAPGQNKFIQGLDAMAKQNAQEAALSLLTIAVRATVRFRVICEVQGFKPLDLTSLAYSLVPPWVPGSEASNEQGELIKSLEGFLLLRTSLHADGCKVKAIPCQPYIPGQAVE